MLTALLLLPDGNELADRRSRSRSRSAPALAIGTLHGLIITKIGVPSFVVTLAGLLAWNGVVLLLIGSRGTVILQNDFVIGLANDFLRRRRGVDPRARSCVGALRGVQLIAVRSARARPGLPTDPLLIVGAADRRRSRSRSAVVVYVANQDRGVPYVGVLVGVLLVFWTLRAAAGRASGATSTRSAATPRPRGAPASTSTACKIAVLRDLLADGGARRHHPRLAPALGRHEHGRRPDRCCTRSPRR